jgi:hypothetical protein
MSDRPSAGGWVERLRAFTPVFAGYANPSEEPMA